MRHILNGPCTMPEALTELGFKDVDAIMDGIKDVDIHDSSRYFSACMLCKRLAYNKLVEAGELDGNEIFRTKPDAPPKHGEIAFRGSETMVFRNGHWMKAF